MSSIQQDLSIFNKFNFERKPVGVKYLLGKPAGIKKLDKTLAFCEMLREAQEAPPFYTTKEDFECVGPLILGMEEPDPIFESGQMGRDAMLSSGTRGEQGRQFKSDRWLYLFGGLLPTFC